MKNRRATFRFNIFATNTPEDIMEKYYCELHSFLDGDENCPDCKSGRVELPVIQNANDIGLDLTLPKRMGWTEFTEDNIVFHYSTEEEYNNCENAKRLGIKVSVSV